VAEGIETEHQVAELRRLRVRRGQGTFFANPLAPPQLERLLGASAGERTGWGTSEASVP